MKKQQDKDEQINEQIKLINKMIQSYNQATKCMCTKYNLNEISMIILLSVVGVALVQFLWVFVIAFSFVILFLQYHKPFYCKKCKLDKVRKVK